MAEQGADVVASRARADVPTKGYALNAAVESYGGPVRELTASLLKTLPAGALREITDALNPTSPTEGATERSTEELGARALSAIWLCHRLTGRDEVTPDELVAWFFGAAAKKKVLSIDKAASALRKASAALPQRLDELSTLLPYVLDPHGPGSRLSVMKDASTKSARKAKKAAGVFYTPGDVADFMVHHALEATDEVLKRSILDVACGTGVFLRAALRAVTKDDPNTTLTVATENLFGIDIDAWAVCASSFVLLHDVLRTNARTRLLPMSIWTRIRKHFACVDALTIDQAKNDIASRVWLGELFPSLCAGADIIVGNPPYTELGPRPDLAQLAQSFATLRAPKLANADTFPMFLEQMVRLTSSDGTGSMVIPLSVASNSGKQFVALRQFIAKTPGEWRFAFFDREPHALFGEDVKTRNAVVHWRRNKKATHIWTGPMKKWRGDDRAKMLGAIQYTRTLKDIAQGIPKLDGSQQAEAFDLLHRQPHTLKHFVPVWGNATLAASGRAKPASVFVAPTAYNFIGVSRPTTFPLGDGEALSENQLVRLTCASEADAHAVYALLSSRLTFWWWHVLGDGFHVTTSMLQDLPFAAALSGTAGKTLSSLGARLWKAVAASPVRSVNRGKTSFSFSVNGHPPLRDEIDGIVCDALGLPASFVTVLNAFVSNVIEARSNTAPGQTSEAVTQNALDWPPTPAKPTREMKDRSVLTKEEWREYTKTVWSIANKSHPDHPAIFPIEIPHRLTKLFSFYGETVLDPFAGTGTTAKAAIPLGRRALCVEQNPEYALIIRKECGVLRNGHDPGFAPLYVVEGDSRDLSFAADNSVGLVVTSPPYWNKADYGSGLSNLGNIGSYPTFIESMRPVLAECHRVLMPGRKLCLVTANVNQHTDHGLLTFPLATDMAVLLRDLGFVMVNELIWSKDGTGGKWGSYGDQRPIFGSYPHPPNFLFKNVHEYILIFAKPPATKTKGPKVKPYSELMAPETRARLVRLPIDLPTIES